MKDNHKKTQDIQRKLIESCRKGNRKAQNEIYRLYYKSMYNTSLRIVGRTELAEDIMQEAFLKAFMNIAQYRGEVSFGAWLKKIVIHRSLDYLRQHRWDQVELHSFENKIIEEEAADIEENISISEIQKEIENLADGYRIVISLYLLEGYDHEEIAEILKISPSTSRSQLARAKKILAQNLKKYKK